MLLPSALGSSPYPPVSVYGTGAYDTIAAFLGASASCFATFLRSALSLAFRSDLVLPSSALAPGFSIPGSGLSPRVPALLTIRSTGISTCCPSATPCGLALGPDLPRADQLHPGNLGYSALRILTPFSLPIPSFSLPATPRLLPVPLRRVLVAPLPLSSSEPMASVSCFSPGYFRRRTSRLVSYYALFKCVAASEPTS